MKHERRLEVLCCLSEGEPRAIAHVVTKTGFRWSEVSQAIDLLGTFDLVEQAGELEGGEPLYAATLDRHPDWVREAVEEHRRQRKG